MGGGAISDISAGEIAAMLNGRAESLAPELLREGVKDGKFFTAGSVAGERGQSLKVNLNGPRKGCWTDFSAAKGADDYSGDMLGLVAVTQYGSQSKEALKNAIAWAKQWLGIDERDPAKLAKLRRAADALRANADADAAREAEQKRKWAMGLWNNSVPIKDTPAQRYLQDRAIDFARLGRVPGSLRFHPAVWCPVRRAKHPAMVACIMGLSGELRGVHRTYLDVSHGKGGPVRAVKVVVAQGRVRVAEPGAPGAKSHKLSIGPYAGGCIPLWKGSCNKTLRDIDPGTPVYCSEGIEDGLSVALGAPERRVVAAVAISNMGGLELPPQAGPLVLIGQNDPANSKAVDAIEGAIARQQEAGRTVQAMFPRPEFKDFNDVLMGKVIAP